MTELINIVFPIYDGVTQLDFTGPHQVLQRMTGARLCVASVDGQPVNSDDGLTFSNLHSLQGIERCDVLCVPGGMRCTDAMQDMKLLAHIRRLASGARYVTSVCSGSLLLGAAGLLTGRRAACHWFWRDLLPVFGAIPDPARVVRDGNLITGGGVTAGIDFALALVAEITGETEAQSIQLKLEYAPAPPFDAGRFETAPDLLGAEIKRQAEASEPARRLLLETIRTKAASAGFADPTQHSH